MLHLKVVGTGAYLPERIVTNKEFEGKPFFEYDAAGRKVSDVPSFFEGDKIFELTGIRERRYAAPQETPSFMAAHAAMQALDASGIDPKSLAGIIVGTVSENVNFASAACKVQKMLGEKYGIARQCFAFDVANACAGGVQAMIVANALVKDVPGPYLVCGAEDVSGMTQNDDRNIILFGAGAGAVVLITTEDEQGILASYSVSNPYEGRDLWITRDSYRFLRMAEGKKVMKEGVECMVEGARKVKERLVNDSITKKFLLKERWDTLTEVGIPEAVIERQLQEYEACINLDWSRADVYIPHQANGRMLDQIARKVESEGAQVFRNIEWCGNMSSATCVIGRHQAQVSGLILPRSRVVMSSVGSGIVAATLAELV